MLRGLNTLNDHRQHLSCVDGLCVDALDLAARMQLLGRLVLPYSAELALVRSNIARLEKSVEVHQRPLAESQSSLLAVEGDHDEYPSRLGIRAQWGGALVELLRSLRNRLVDHTSLVDSPPEFPRQDMDLAFDTYLRAIF